MITLTIDEKDAHVLRVSASYLLALAAPAEAQLQHGLNQVAAVHNEMIDAIHDAQTEISIDKPTVTFNASELAEAETLGQPHFTGHAMTDQPDPAVIFGGKPSNVVPFTAAADPLTTAPVDTTATTVTAPPGVPSPPAASEPSAALAVALPTVLPAVDVDARGLPWDSRIHSREKTKLETGKTAGNWRNKRGVEPAVIAQVEAELASLMAIPASAPIATAVVPPPPLVVAEVVSAPAATTVAPPPPATTAAIANLSSEPFPALIQKVTAAIAAKTLNNGQVLEIVKSLGLNALPDLVPRPDFIPQVEMLIDAKIVANINSGVAV